MRERLSAYEEEQIARIAAWKGRRPNALAHAYGRITSPFSRMFVRIVPGVAARGLVEQAYRSCGWQVGLETIRKIAGVAELSELREGTLERSDKLAREVEALTREVATAESLVSGVGGLATDLLDIPAELILALQSVHRIAACYGFELDRPEDKTLVLMVLALSLAESPEDRELAEQRIWLLKTGKADTTIEQNAVRQVEDEVIAEVESTILENKLEEAVPIFGSVAGLVLDGAFIGGVERAAQCVFQERWLRARGKVEEIAAVDVSPYSRASLAASLTNACYSTGFTIGFAVTLPVALVMKAGSATLPPPMRDGFREGASDAIRDVEARTGHGLAERLSPTR
jgi:EcsC protein family